MRRSRGRPKKSDTSTTALANGNGATGTPAQSSTVTRHATQRSLFDSPFVQTLTIAGASASYTEPNVYDAKKSVSKLIETLSSIILHRLSYGDPCSDLLVHVTTFNSLRGIIYIMGVLDMAVNEMDDDNSISSFNAPDYTVVARRRVLPESLRPTALQLAVPHHPWIDAFPFPSFRNSLLTHADALAADEGELSDVKLCSDTLGLDVRTSAGLLVWGDPWDASAWELSEAFFTKWCWILYGCDELLASTNYWRASRGEPSLCWDLAAS